MRAGFQWERLARVRFFTLPFSRKDSRRRMAGGELRLGMVEMYIPTIYHINLPCQGETSILHDYIHRPKRSLTTEPIATYLNLGEGRSVRASVLASQHGSSP